MDVNTGGEAAGENNRITKTLPHEDGTHSCCVFESHYKLLYHLSLVFFQGNATAGNKLLIFNHN